MPWHFADNRSRSDNLKSAPLIWIWRLYLAGTRRISCVVPSDEHVWDYSLHNITLLLRSIALLFCYSCLHFLSLLLFLRDSRNVFAPVRECWSPCVQEWSELVIARSSKDTERYRCVFRSQSRSIFAHMSRCGFVYVSEFFVCWFFPSRFRNFSWFVSVCLLSVMILWVHPDPPIKTNRFCYCVCWYGHMTMATHVSPQPHPFPPGFS